MKEHAAVVNQRSYSVQITELQSPLEDIIEDSESINEQSSDGRNSGNGSVLEVQTSFKNDKLNKRLTTFKRGSHRSKPEIGNITTGKAEETSDNDDSINSICHTKTQTEQSVLNSNTINIESHQMEHIPCINSRSEHEDNYHPTKDFKEQYQPNKPTITINQDSKTETENKKCPELALQVDFVDTKDTKNFPIPARDIIYELSGNTDPNDVQNSTRRESYFANDLTCDYDDINDPEDASHTSRRQIDFSICSNELTSDYDDIEEHEDASHASRRQNKYIHAFTCDYDDINDSEDVTASSRRQLDFTNEFPGGDYDDIDTSEEMSTLFRPSHVFTSEQIPDYDEIDDRKDAVTPNEEKHLFTKNLSLDDIYDGIEEITTDGENASKFTLTAQKDRKSSIGQFDDYDEIEDSRDAMYTTTEPYIGMSHRSSATIEQYMDMSHGIRATQLSDSEDSSSLNTSSNNPSLTKLTNEPIYAISTKKSIKSKLKESDVEPKTLSNSENITSTNTYSTNPSSSITNEPIYAISTKKSIKIKSKEPDLVAAPVYAISSKKSSKM